MANRSLILFTIFISLVGCQKQPSQISSIPDIHPIERLKDLLAEDEIQILDTNFNPVSDAQLTIGNITYTTDASGYLIIPKNWTQSETLLIEKAGYITTVYHAQLPVKNVYTVRPSALPKTYEVKGITNGYPSLSKDGYVDFSIVTEPFTQADVMDFDITKLMSEQTDTMTVMGQKLSVPSNISIPKQSENYSFFSLTLDKPLYRFYFSSQGQQELAALRGRFELKTVVDKLRNGAAFFDVINDFKFQSTQVTGFNINVPSFKQDLNTTAMPLASPKTHTAPNYDASLVYISAAMTKTGAKYTPTDLKFFKQNESLPLLQANNGVDSYLLAYLGEKVKQSNNTVTLSPKMSLAFSPFNSATGSELLDVVETPVIQNTKIILNAPTAKAGIQKFSTIVTISEVKIKITHNLYRELKNTVLEVYSADWANEVEIPAHLMPNKSYRVEITYLGSSNKQQSPLGPLQSHDATHATRNATDIL